MPWKKIQAGEMRRKFIRARVARLQSMRSLCRQFGISRECGYKWWRRFLREGQRGLVERPRRPQWAQAWRARWWRRLGVLRRRDRDFGPEKLQWHLRRWPRERVPGIRTLGRWLAAAGQVRRRVRRRRPGPRVARLRPVQARRPNEVWTADLKGWFRTGDGTRVVALTVRDLASRYVLAVCHVPTSKVPPIRRLFRRLFRRWGYPRAIRVDNGAPFGGPGPRG